MCSINNIVLKHTSFKNIGLSNLVFGGIIEDCSFDNCGFKTVKFHGATIINTFFKHNRKFNRVEFIDCRADKLTYAFLKRKVEQIWKAYLPLNQQVTYNSANRLFQNFILNDKKSY